jgi:hypothetical protein
MTIKVSSNPKYGINFQIVFPLNIFQSYFGNTSQREKQILMKMLGNNMSMLKILQIIRLKGDKLKILFNRILSNET